MAYRISVYTTDHESEVLRLVHSQVEDDEETARWKAGMFAVLGLPYDGITGPAHPDGPGPNDLLVNVTAVE